MKWSGGAELKNHGLWGSWIFPSTLKIMNMRTFSFFSKEKQFNLPANSESDYTYGVFGFFRFQHCRQKAPIRFCSELGSPWPHVNTHLVSTKPRVGFAGTWVPGVPRAPSPAQLAKPWPGEAKGKRKKGGTVFWDRIPLATRPQERTHARTKRNDFFLVGLDPPNLSHKSKITQPMPTNRLN